MAYAWLQDTNIIEADFPEQFSYSICASAYWGGVKARKTYARNTDKFFKIAQIGISVGDKMLKGRYE